MSAAWPACRSVRCRSMTRWRSISRGRSSRRRRRISGPKRLWPGLEELQPKKLSADEIDGNPGLVEELKQRLLVIQALETARIVEEGVLTDVREGDVGSILGFGFAPFTGGTLSYIDMMGTKKFVDLCTRFEKKYGPRFAPPKLLVE